MPYVKECWEAIVAHGWPTGGITPPDRCGYTITQPAGKSFIEIRTLQTPQDVDRCKRIPEYRTFSSVDRCWTCKPTKTNVDYLIKAFPQAAWLGSAFGLKQEAVAISMQAPKDMASQIMATYDKTITVIDDYAFRTSPYPHQLEAFGISRHLVEFAYFMEQGTGKTWVAINNACYLFLQKKIDGLLVICPNAMKDVWDEQLQEHATESIDLDIFVWEARTRHKAEAWILRQQNGVQPLRVLIMNTEAFSGEIGARVGSLFVARHGTYAVVDESTKIKSNSAKRTKTITKIGKGAYYRRIMSGAPVVQSPLDIYSQARFLNIAWLGHSSYWSFRNRYAIMGGFNMRQVVGYAHLDELQALIAKFSYRKLKSECLNLPEKIYEKRLFDLEPDQQQLYDDMKNDMQAELQGQKYSVTIALQKITALSRICGGFFPYDGEDEDGLPMRMLTEIPGTNPKLVALYDLIEDSPGDKFIIWAKFTAEIEMIGEALAETFGQDQVVLFYGKTTKAERKANRLAFQNNPERARFFVGQAKAGGMGLTLTASHQVVYYSNDYDLEARIQSEDRAHRIGQTKNVVYTDLVAKGTIDLRLLTSLRNKKGLADLVTGDPTFSWL
jgi:SNF2 family DNA or RNA helicase